MTRDRDLCESWLAHARSSEVARAMAEIEAEIERQIDARRPVCTASGRCCNFERFGHRLYVTGLETAMTLDSIPTQRVINPGDLERAHKNGSCPFVVGGLCGVHPVRPIGCRVYFCDTSAQLWVNELAERAVDLVKRVHERFAIEYRYAEWRSMLGMFQASGVGDVPERPVRFAPSDPFVRLTSGRA